MTTCTSSKLSQEIHFLFFFNGHINNKKNLQINVRSKCVYCAQ